MKNPFSGHLHRLQEGFNQSYRARVINTSQIYWGNIFKFFFEMLIIYFFQRRGRQARWTAGDFIFLPPNITYLDNSIFFSTSSLDAKILKTSRVEVLWDGFFFTISHARLGHLREHIIIINFTLLWTRYNRMSRFTTIQT